MAPTSLQDPERARKQRLQYPPPDESDWRGLLLGLALAIGSTGLLVATVWLMLGGGAQ